MTYRIFMAMLVVAAATQMVAASDGDWPMWRSDANRSAATTNELPKTLKRLWSKNLSPRTQVWDDPLNLDLMTYDRVFEPIVVDGRVLVGFNDQNKLVALDADTGDVLWTVYAEAPVRLPPAAWRGRVYFCSDDGHLYCVDVTNGELIWKFHGAPSAQHALGNRRLTSAWPARGGPVVRDDTVYFSASIWPFMGTFIYALDADTGEVQWKNDQTGAHYIKQPHSAPAFAGVAPQGALVATEKLLLIPGGRSVPAALDRDNGKLRYFHFSAGGKGTGGSFVTADENRFYVHTRRKGTRAFKLADGVKTAFTPSEPVLHDGMIYTAVEKEGEPVVRAYDSNQEEVWEINADASGDLILAGPHLVAAGKESITVIALPRDGHPARALKVIPTQQGAERLIVADEKLFAVTLGGHLWAFGDPLSTQGTTSQPTPPPRDHLSVPEDSIQTAAELLKATDAQGYAIWYGSADSTVARAIALDSPFEQFAIVDNDADSVDRLRPLLDASSLYGRVTVHHSRAADFLAPSYVANVVLLGEELAASADKATLKELYRSVRPYGGVMHLLMGADRERRAEQIRSLDLEQAQVEVGRYGVIVRRVGALPGSADWTHQYGDVANSVKSDDDRVKLPLGILWFGGSSNKDVLPRHGHGPPEQVIGGRLFIQGTDGLSARDVYTGRVLWKRAFKDLGTFDVYYDKTYEDVPLNPKYNQVHIPGANGRGTNYVATEDRIYLIEGGLCHVLDSATGKTLTDFRLPGAEDQEEWGYIGVYQDVLIGGLGFANYRDRKDLAFESDKQLRASREGFGSKSYDRAASMGLVGFDRYSGEVLWQRDARHSFWHNGIVAGGDLIYCLDRNPRQVEEAMRRRGKTNPDTYRIVAIDYRTGKKKWQMDDGVFGTWLGYSEKHHSLLQAGAAASDRLATESSRGMAVHSAVDGSLIWKNESLKYAGPCILHNDWIITNANSYRQSAGAFRIADGKQKMVKHPITGKKLPWTMTRSYGCNNIIASENLLTFRSGAAGFYDLLTDSGTGNLGGFKSGCTSNLVVAGGVLNAPDYTRTCSCGYQNQTSLALVPMPSVDTWSVHPAVDVETSSTRINGIGINLGAPGDRRDDRGRLWVEYPPKAGPTPSLSITLNQDARFYQHHSSVAEGLNLPWIRASGVDRLTNLRLSLNLKSKSNLEKGIPISHSDDDAEEDEGGKVNLDSSDLELVEEAQSQLVGIRFNNLPLRADTKINGVFVQFTCDETSDQKTTLAIAAEDTGDAKRFSDDRHNLSSRTQTPMEVNWSPQAWTKTGKSGELQRTPNLAPLFKSIIDRPDWKSGNSVVLLISGAGKRVAKAWGKNSNKMARLILEVADQHPRLPKMPTQDYRVRFIFGLPEPEDEERIFDVYAQGKLVLKDVTLSHQPGKNSVTRVLGRVPIANDLRLRFVPHQGNAMLSGIELVRIRQ